MSNDYEEPELDEKLIKEFSSSLETAINKVLANNFDKDPRLELLTTLMSFSSQVAQDLGMDEKGFAGLAKDFYQENEEEDIVIEEIKPKKKSKPKAN